MNEFIEKRIVECYQTVDGLNRSLGDSILSLLDLYGERFYKLIDDENRKLISFEIFREKVLEFTVEKDPPKVLKDLKIEPWLEPVWRGNDKSRWNNYKKLLESEGKEKMVSQLDADTFAILDNCYNPKTEGQWERKGLVYGHVQSGKTANYIGLVNKALDVGYRIIIIFTGMTEDLRKQTQDRINSGVRGRDENDKKYGVGNFPSHDFNNIKPGTGMTYDLNKNNVDSAVNTLSLNQNIIFVVKKNVAVLNCLIKWLNKKSIAQDPNQYRIINTPFLIIDDEADNASIQSLSKKEFQIEQDALLIKEIEDADENDLTPEQIKILEDAKNATIKAINRNIRIILSLVAQKSFVGYTATPYSVIAQRTEGIEHEWEIEGIKYKIDENSDLFPEHFIIPLEPGIKYMGIEKTFGSKRINPLPVLFTIPEKDASYFPTGRNSDYDFLTIPDSLEKAVIHFIVAIFIRKFRNQNQHNTMLVHTSHKVDKIDFVAHKISEYFESFKDRLKTDPLLNAKFEKELELIRKNSKNEIFEKYFDLDLKQYTVPEEITTSDIYSIISKISLISYHSKENDPTLKHHNHKLNYPNLEKEPEKTRFYIVIGGNRIARGFTLEGLTTSYFVRESSTQDTLYQMGRWFGYRIGYEDTVQIFMPKNQIAWYRDISYLELDLRDDLAQMNENEMTPSMWEIKMVNSKSFESLNKKITLCNANRLHNTQKKKLSFGGTNQMTKKFKRINSIHKANLNVTMDFFNNLAVDHDFSDSKLYINDTNINFSNIPVLKVISFLSKFQFHEDEIFDTLQTFLNKNENELDSFSIVLKQNEYKKDNEISPVWKIKDKPNITSLVRASAEGNNLDIDYRLEQLLDSDKDNTFDIIDSEQKVEYYNILKKDKNKRKAALDFRYKLRNESKKAILIVYIIKGEMEKGEGEIFFPSLYISVPDIGEPVEYTIRNKKAI